LNPPSKAAAQADNWVLLRGVRQLLTLRGPSGPRCGPALSELNRINDAAILIRNGIIEQVGMARRVENLKEARLARVIDTKGSVVIPAFVDPDVALVSSVTDKKHGALERGSDRLSVTSTHRLTANGKASAAERVRSGVLSVGSHTGTAVEPRDVLRVLRIHRTLESKPLRIRSICRMGLDPASESAVKILSTVKKRGLGSILEFAVGAETSLKDLESATIVAAQKGYLVRMRIQDKPTCQILRATFNAASSSLIAGPVENDCARGIALSLGKFGCVHVLPASQALDGKWVDGSAIRRSIDEGMPIALSVSLSGGTSSINAQFLLRLAVERCGMTPEEAIVASTYNAACSLRMSHVTGSLEPGKSADLLVMGVSEYQDLFQRVGHNDVRMAMRAGNIVYHRGGLSFD
jgi:imidazolonepropionase